MRNIHMPSQEREKWDALSRMALAHTAKFLSRDNSDVVNGFKSGDVLITRVFWLMIQAAEPERIFNRVEYCESCDRFHLWKSGKKAVFQK